MSNFTSSFINSQVGRYQIQERIGSGGMARVFKAYDTNLDRPVAIKILHEHLAEDATFKERFEREAKFVASFNHPNIVQIYDFDSIKRDGQAIFYMVMPLIPGKSLEKVLSDLAQREEALPRDRILRIMQDLTSAIDYAHERGMVHRDVKPANILFDENDRAVLTDFGIARLAEHSNLTQEGVVVGTPAYMSPEQVAGGQIDNRSDIYALGIIFYEMLTGQPPFKDDGSLSVLLQHINAPVPSLSEFTHMPEDNLDAVVFRALAKNADERYQTAANFAADIQAAFAGQQVTPPSPTMQLPLQIAGVNTGQLMQPGIAHPTSRRVYQSPIGILAIGLVFVTLILVIGLVSQRETTAPSITPTRNSISDTGSGGDSMTGEILYFRSGFDNDEPLLLMWQQDDVDDVIRTIENGIYRLENRLPRNAATSNFDPAYRYEDVTITMIATLDPDSADASGYGIVFRYIDQDHYNVFAVDGRGRFSIWVRDGGWRELRGLDEDWTEHEAVHPIGESNDLTLMINGTTLTGYVNGMEVVTLEDDTYSEGGVGIYLASTSDANTIVLVDSYETTDETPSFSDSMAGE